MKGNSKITVYALFVAVGIIIGLIGGILLSKNSSSVPEKEEVLAITSEAKVQEVLTSESKSEITDIAQENTPEETSGEFETWKEAASYNGGVKVSYKGVVFESKWWTQGEVPDKNNEWGAWKALGVKPIEGAQQKIEQIPSNLIKKDGFKVVGYYPSWKPEQIDKIQYDKLTHINYAFAIPTSEGGLRPLENEETAKLIIKEAHKQGVKVLLAVGGWEYQGTPLENTFMAATATDEKCKNLANEIVKMVEQYGFDGVDMDWEHPRTDGKSKDQYQALIKYLDNALEKKDKLLTTAVLAGVSADGWEMWDAAAHTDEVLKCVDWINVMAYDGGDGSRHSPFEFAMSSSNYWITTRGVPGDKVVLGVPFYGRPSWKSYEEILALDKDATSKDEVNQIYYNGIGTIKNKTNWALAHLGGVMIWELTQDTNQPDKSLINAIYEEVHRNQ